MNEYNTHCRQKSLLEQHQEKAKHRKGQDHRPHKEKM
jgi:hypothetical protein